MNAERVMGLMHANHTVNIPPSLLSWDPTGTSQSHSLPNKLETTEIEIKGGRTKKNLKISPNNFSLNKYACFKIHLGVSDKEMRIPTSNST